MPFEWIWYLIVFAFGSCIGSFLNVVIYRVPRSMSLVHPPSTCPSCGKRISFYNNIPVLSWLLLGGKCSSCKTKISARYFFVEVLTGLLYLTLFIVYFRTGMRSGIESFPAGGWFIFVIHILFVSCLVAASGIDMQFWIIPLSICWLMTAIGIVASTVAPWIIHPVTIRTHQLFPYLSDMFVNGSTIAALTVGATVGLAMALVLLATGVIKRSYPWEEDEFFPDQPESEQQSEPECNHRLEVLKELVFLAPVIIGALIGYAVLKKTPMAGWWLDMVQLPWLSGLLASIWGYFIGCAIVWATRIFGTLGFGKEAMGLGDVHLMGAAGAILGPWPVVVAFFVAPFFGLAWAICQMFFRKIRQIPYGPFLSAGLFTVMIFHDWIFNRLAAIYQ